MARKSSKRPSNKKSTRKKGATSRTGLRDLLGKLQPPHWPHLRTNLERAGWVLGVAAIAVAWFLGVPRLTDRVAQGAWANTVTVEFVDRPAWVRGDLLAMLDLTAQEELTGDPLAQEDLARTHTALLDTGWFDSIEQIRRVRADHVVVEATFVRPTAVIRDGEGDHLVDDHGLLLPRMFPHDGAKAQIVITGVHFSRPQRPGLPWDGADVSAALRLLRLLEDEPWRDQATSIDTGSFVSDGELVLVTDQGARIVWGSAPGEESSLEVTSETKLAYLRRAWEEFGRIDTGHRGVLRFYDRGYFAE